MIVMVEIKEKGDKDGNGANVGKADNAVDGDDDHNGEYHIVRKNVRNRFIDK